MSSNLQEYHLNLDTKLLNCISFLLTINGKQ